MNAKSLMMSLAVLPLATFADTVAWWHLDELQVGEFSDNANTVFTNAVDATKHKAYPRTSALGKWSTSNSYRPQGAEAFADGGCWYDLVAGSHGVNPRGVEFRPHASKVRNSGPIIDVPYSAELCPDDFTYEFFYKPDPTFSDKSIQYIIFDRAAATNGVANVGFRIHYHYASTGSRLGLVVVERPYDAVGKTNTYIRSEISSPWSAGNNNSLWHHAAITYENSSRKMRFYVDYALAGSVTLTIDPKSTNDFSLGGSTESWGAYEGYIDEFRISD